MVAATVAFDDYQLYSAYFCRRNRSFRTASHMAFYTGAIQPLIPEILAVYESISLTEEGLDSLALDGKARAAVRRIIEIRRQQDKIDGAEPRKVILLSPPDGIKTMKLARPISNDRHTPAGGIMPFVQGHRYVPLDVLRREPKTTSELLRLMAPPKGED